MKVLKIEDNKGLFIRSDNTYAPITTISSQDILTILGWILDEESIIMDQCDETELRILNDAEKIIYQELYKRFLDVISRKKEIINSVDAEFEDAINKYIVNNVPEGS